MRPLGIQNGLIGQLFTVTAERLQLGSPSTLVVVASSITISKSWHRVDSTSGAGSTTNLVNILGGIAGDVLVLQAANDAKTISLRDNTGNLRLAGNCNLDTLNDTIVLLFDGSVWFELCRSNN